jgi:methylmalonyl-CoA mutase
MTNTSQDALIPLAADFEPADESAWLALAQAGLKGLPFDRLIGRTPDGIAVKPLYRAPDFQSSTDAAGLPGQAPFTRGPSPARDPYLPWDIRQTLTNPAAANTDALTDLGGGVSSLELEIARPGRPGLAVEQIDAALAEVRLDLAPIALDAGAAGLAAAHALLDAYQRAAPPTSDARPVFNLDPFSDLPLDATAPDGAILAGLEAFTTQALKAFPAALIVRADGRAAHNAGATPAQELAVMLAAGAAYLRALEPLGYAPTAAARLIQCTLAAGPDVIVEIAKLRAARMVWAHMLGACGVAPAACAMTLQAVSSARAMTRDDAWTNTLRVTACTFAAAAGGADAITALPLTFALGHAGDQARRIARNTQIILMEESHLGRVADPGGGAWALERLTQDIAAAAWASFQKIETGGGLAGVIASGALAKDIDEAHARAADAVAKRKFTLTGVSDFPLLGQTAPGFVAAAAPLRTAPALFGLRRLSEPFEALRDRAERIAPKAFCATLGALSAFSARANFAKNLLAAGGVALIGEDQVYADDATLSAAFTQSGATLAVLCGADADYAARGETAVRVLRASGAGWVVYAGKPADEASWRAAGVDQFIFAGQNAPDALSTLHTALGIAP